MRQEPKNLNLEIKTSEFSVNMSLNFGRKEEPTKEERARKLGEILEKFSSLSHEHQDLILEFAEFIEKKIEGSNGQDPHN
jgi:hypothetical protein